MAKTNVTFTNFAAKKLLGKAQTRPAFTEEQEAYPSQVSIPGGGVFAETLPREPGTEFFVQYSASAGAPATVEKVYFDVVAIGDGFYDGDQDSTFGGEAGQNATNHAFYLKLPSNYETTSSNPNKGAGTAFTNGAKLYESRGALQLVPPFVTDAGLPGAGGNNQYFLDLYSGTPSGGTLISTSDPSDWYVDYYAGIIFIQDSASAPPVTASAYLYTGKYLDTKLTDLSASIGSGGNDVVDDGTPQLGGDLDVNGNDIISVSDGDIKLMPDGDGKVIIDGNGTDSGISIDNGAIHMRNGGSVSEIRMYCEYNNAHYVRFAAPPHAQFSGNPDFVLPPNEGSSGQVLKTDGSGNTSWTSVLAYGRTEVTSHVTASISDRILGVTATASLDIRLPAASDYTSGQFFIVKDEGGNADTYNITIKTSGTDEIDGVSSIILESPYGAVNIYSDGSSKFFIY